MKRIQFIKTIGIGLLGVGPLQSVHNPVKPTSILHTYIAGMPHSLSYQDISKLRVGQQLELCPEANNPYDDRAVMIKSGGKKIDYIPATDNQVIFNLLTKTDQKITCTLTHIQPTKAFWDGYEIEILLHQKSFT